MRRIAAALLGAIALVGLAVTPAGAITDPGAAARCVMQDATGGLTNPAAIPNGILGCLK
ncbi:hypothetical protein LN042_00070 [Kitasatospora sp. RB6PN24]|uniref:hypothetical protein n=1 Tax=Kitasatospora humi TaxID=2893891 RepID=UPI001E5FBF7C|nr:hypothetical protein [Kitasatospora humi]MCC9305524.1 hypothetical protein [Kitasatospora humi]